MSDTFFISVGTALGVQIIWPLKESRTRLKKRGCKRKGGEKNAERTGGLSHWPYVIKTRRKFARGRGREV